MTTCATMSSSVRRPGRGAGGRRDRGPEEGCALGRGAAAVHRHRRADRERPGRGVPGLRRPPRARADRPRLVPAASLGRGPRPLRRRGRPRTGWGSPPSRRWRPRMIAAAVAAGVPAAWVAGDEVYGADPRLRAHDPRPRAGLRPGSVAANRRVPTARRPDPRRCAARAAARAGVAETTLPVPAAKGPRFYSWAWITARRQ